METKVGKFGFKIGYNPACARTLLKINAWSTECSGSNALVVYLTLALLTPVTTSTSSSRSGS